MNNTHSSSAVICNTTSVSKCHITFYYATHKLLQINVVYATTLSATDHLWDTKHTEIVGPTKNVLPSNYDLSYYNPDDAKMRALHQSFVLTPATEAAVFPSVQQPTTNFTYVIKSNAYVKNMFYHTLLITNMLPSLFDHRGSFTTVQWIQQSAI
jgi:hypothetical protein